MLLRRKMGRRPKNHLLWFSGSCLRWRNTVKPKKKCRLHRRVQIQKIRSNYFMSIRPTSGWNCHLRLKRAGKSEDFTAQQWLITPLTWLPFKTWVDIAMGGVPSWITGICKCLRRKLTILSPNFLGRLVTASSIKRHWFCYRLTVSPKN